MYELIAYQNLTSTATSITFSNIPQIYSDLYLVMTPRGTSSNISDDLVVLINDSSSNFSYRSLTGWSSVAAYSGTNNFFGWTNGNNTSPFYSSYAIQFTNYTSAVAKIITIDGVGPNFSTSDYLLNLIAHRWNPTVQSPITKITLRLNNSVSFAASTSATLYGINRTSGIGRAPLAMGGYMSYSNGYWVHTFPSSGSFIPFTNMDVEYLVVGGGGGGGFNFGTAGGGAGGYRSSVVGELSGANSSAESRLSLTANTNYTVTVGAGGAGDTNGSNSVFSTITSTGGGGGAGHDNAPGNGGSGGGGRQDGNTSAVGTGTTGQGFSGGAGFAAGGGTGGGGGGGGASATGTAAGNNAGGNGGNGLVSSITGTAIARAGGGGGGSQSGTVGTGGIGGGANGSNSSVTGGNSGSANTGGGGGGCGNAPAPGAGGSGIVIVRYRA